MSRHIDTLEKLYEAINSNLVDTYIRNHDAKLIFSVKLPEPVGQATAELVLDGVELTDRIRGTYHITPRGTLALHLSTKPQE